MKKSKVAFEAESEGNPFRSFGEQLQAVAKYALSSKTLVDPRLTEVQNAAAGLSAGVPSDGGFLVQQDFTTQLIEQIMGKAVLAQDCLTIPISETRNGLKAPIIDETSRATGSRWGGVQVYRQSETGTAQASKPKFGLLDISLEKLIGLCYATEELLGDTEALGTIITQAFGSEFGFAIDNEILHGTGAGQMLGILNSDALVTVPKEGGQTADTIVAENVVKMYARMWSRGLPTAKWYVNSEALPQLFTMKIGDTPIFIPPGGMPQAPSGTLLGRPVVPVEQCSALGDVGDIMFGDLSQYLIIDKGGVRASQSIHVQFLTDEQAFKFVLRNNGQPIWKKALTPFKGTATVSPFVALEAR
ncbi:MAG TPA: phage major capsid protein [Dissulfurispiraceae bacterium]|nr:phage major capsid protein [Dissulfurispiraceae bacterium]